MTDFKDNVEFIQLERENELQFILSEPGDKITIQLMAGSAEIFGSELQSDEVYEFSYFSSVSIFTWHGCTLKIQKEVPEYNRYKIKASTQIPKMWNIHKYLEEIRRDADAHNTNYPITLLTGETDVGKSTLCRYLLNYAAKHGRRSVFLDLDVGQSSLSITGTFGVLPVYEPSNVKGKFNEQALSVYYFGYKSPGHNMKLYKLLLEKVGQRLKRRLQQDNNENISGVLIDTCGWVDGPGYRLLQEIIEVLNVNTILVLSKNSLYSKLKRDVSPRTKILSVDKFKDVTIRNQTIRADNRNSCIYEYFYGYTKRLRPYTFKVNFSDIQIFKANYSSKNDNYTSDVSNVVPILIEPQILYQVLGLSYAEHIENIPLTSVYGFICIIEIDMNLEVVTILSPQPGPLPSNYLLMGDITMQSDMIS